MRNATKNNVIPVNAPLLSPDAKQNVLQCLQSGWISSGGAFVERFEREFSDYVGMKHGIAVSSGTAALHCALLSLGVGRGDEVIVPAFSMIAAAFSVLFTGAVPVFVDCEPDTFNLDPEQVKTAVTKRTRAIMPVHMFGHPCDMDSIRPIAAKHRLAIIEDAAEAHGASYKDKLCGSFGELSCFSFYANKIVTTGEGGMVLTQNDRLAKRLRSFRDLCHSEKKRFLHDDVGYNYRLSNVQAAIGLGQLQHIDEYIQRKRAIADAYTRKLNRIPGIRTPVTRSHVQNVFWMYTILVDEKKFGMNRDALTDALLEQGIETRGMFYPPHQQPALKKHLGSLPRFPVAERLSKTGCYLPSGLAITDEHIDRVSAVIKNLV